MLFLGRHLSILSSWIAEFQTRSCIKLDLSLIFATFETDFKKDYLQETLSYSTSSQYIFKFKSIKDVDLCGKGA